MKKRRARRRRQVHIAHRGRLNRMAARWTYWGHFKQWAALSRWLHKQQKHAPRRVKRRLRKASVFKASDFLSGPLAVVEAAVTE